MLLRQEGDAAGAPLLVVLASAPDEGVTAGISINDFLTPVIYLSSPAKMTLQVGLSYFRGQFNTEWNLLMAGTVIAVLPVLVLYMVAQRYFVQGIALAGLKG